MCNILVSGYHFGVSVWVTYPAQRVAADLEPASVAEALSLGREPRLAQTKFVAREVGGSVNKRDIVDETYRTNKIIGRLSPAISGLLLFKHLPRVPLRSTLGFTLSPRFACS